MSSEWNYIGDQNLELGGTFFRAENPDDGRNPAIKVSEAPHDQEEFVIEQGYILAAPEALQEVLEACEFSITEDGQFDADGEIFPIDSDTAKKLKVEAFFNDSGIWEAQQTYVSQDDLAGRTIAEYIRDECFLEAYPVIDGPEGIEAPARTM